MGNLSASSLLSPAIYDLRLENVHRVEWALDKNLNIWVDCVNIIHLIIGAAL